MKYLLSLIQRKHQDAVKSVPQFGMKFLWEVQILSELGYEQAKKAGIPVCELHYR